MKKKSIFLWILALVVVALLSFAAGAVFSPVTITEYVDNPTGSTDLVCPESDCPTCDECVACDPEVVCTDPSMFPTDVPEPEGPAVTVGEPLASETTPFSVNAERTNGIIDSILALNSKFEDPRVSCDSMVGDGLVLGEEEACIPQYPEVGFCVEGSEDLPCDFYVVAFYSLFSEPDELSGPFYVGGFDPGYVFAFVSKENFQSYVDVFPYPGDFGFGGTVWFYQTVIPFTSAYTDALFEMNMPAYSGVSE